MFAGSSTPVISCYLFVREASHEIDAKPARPAGGNDGFQEC